MQRHEAHDARVDTFLGTYILVYMISYGEMGIFVVFIQHI